MNYIVTGNPTVRAALLAATLIPEGSRVTFITHEELLQKVQTGEIDPADALGAVSPPALEVFDEVTRWSDLALGRSLGVMRRYEARKKAPQQCEYLGPRGRAKVTFSTDGRQAIVSRQKPSGAWKKVGTFPWPERGADTSVALCVASICGQDNHLVEKN